MAFSPFTKANFLINNPMTYTIKSLSLKRNQRIYYLEP